MLLINRCTSPQRTLYRATAGAAEEIHEALCAVAEAFAAVLTGAPRGQAWRGGALASLRSMIGQALHGVPDRILVDHEPTWEAVCARLAGDPAPVAAFDALYSRFGDNAGKFALFGSIYDRPADTRDLRACPGSTGRLRKGLR